MFHDLDLPGRAAAFLTLSKLAPPGPGPAHTKANALAELLTLWRPDGRLTAPLLLLLAEEVAAHGAVAAGRHGYCVYDADALACAVDSRPAALLILRLAGASCDPKGKWADKEFANSDPVAVTFPADFFGDLFADLAESFGTGCDPDDAD